VCKAGGEGEERKAAKHESSRGVGEYTTDSCGVAYRLAVARAVAGWPSGRMPVPAISTGFAAFRRACDRRMRWQSS
jgi:hypothetical protein